jgi:anti-sigma regulatory factor (Ser/Thr protein kinase)
MSDRQEVVISSEIDIVTARLRVRRYAQAKGLDTKDQACVSLAVSTLAHALDLDGARRGRVIIDSVQDGDQIGVRVICTRESGDVGDLPRRLENARWMVDQMGLEELTPTGVKVTVVKWKGGKRELGSSVSELNLDRLGFLQADGG